MSDEVLLERHDGWAEIVLNRPATKNAINGPFGELLADVCNRQPAAPIGIDCT